LGLSHANSVAGINNRMITAGNSFFMELR
jgi:hypothetical protein